MTDLEDEDAQMRRTKEGRDEFAKLYCHCISMNKNEILKCVDCGRIHYSNVTSDPKEDKLDAIFRMQRYFADQLQSDGKFPYPREVALERLCTAMSHEVHELQNQTSWKWWKKPTEFSIPEAREELIDIFHFVIHAALVLGMTPQDFLDVYNKKMKINKQRQEQGY